MQEGQTRKTSSLSILAIAGVEPYQEKPGEEYMNVAQLTHFKKILEAWRNQLRDEVDRTVSHMQDEAANFPDPVDRAAQEEEFSLELRNRDRERKLIKKIEKTLKKVEDEDFGYCDSCGVEIGIRRLEARPTADLCIDCKTLAEIREKQMAGVSLGSHAVHFAPRSLNNAAPSFVSNFLCQILTPRHPILAALLPHLLVNSTLVR
ncbi:DnaK suppressor protein [Ewingella americana]